MARKKGFRIPGLSFSWKRAVGLTQLKAKASRKIGIPFTKAGRQRKLAGAAGCCIPALLIGGAVLLATAAAGYGLATII